jgi:hypothetical protein
MASDYMTETEALQFLARSVVKLTEAGNMDVFKTAEDATRARLAMNTLGFTKAADVISIHLRETLKQAKK